MPSITRTIPVGFGGFSDEAEVAFWTGILGKTVLRAMFIAFHLLINFAKLQHFS